MRLSLSPSLFKNTLLYSIANVLSAGIPYLMLPILTNHLDQGQYGILSMLTIMVTFAGPFVGLSLNGAVSRAYYSPEKFTFTKYVGNCIVILVCSTVIISFLCILFSGALERLTDIPRTFLVLAILLSFCQYIMFIQLAIWQVRLKPVTYGVFQISSAFVNFMLSYVMVVYCNMGWQGRIYGWLIAWGAFSVFALIILFGNERVTLKPDIKSLKHALQFSLPLIPHSIGGLFIGIVDRLIVKEVLGIEQTGIYTVAYQIASVLNVLTMSFNTAYLPWLFSRLSKKDDAINISTVRYSYLFFIGIALIVMACCLSTPLIFKFFIGEKFQDASRHIYLLFIAFGFNGMYLVVTNYIFYAEKTYLLSISTLIIALTNIPICYYLTKVSGIHGAALSASISYGLLFIITWIMAIKIYPMPWFKWRKLIPHV